MRHTPLPVLAATCAALLLVLGACSRPRDPDPVVSRTVDGVDAIELRHRGFGNARLEPGHFSLGYARWANYPVLVYRGEAYRRAGPGSVFIRPGQGTAPRYLVEETALESGGRYGEPLSGLAIVDRATGEVLAHRLLRDGQVEDGNGWTGQHAAEFVRKVLRTDAPVGGAVGVKAYGKAEVRLEVLADAIEPGAEEGGDACPASYRRDKTRGRSVLDTDAWVFMPQSHLNSFACHGKHILIQSGYGNWLYLDLLMADGRHVFQTDLHTPNNGNVRIAVKRLRIRQAGPGKRELQVDVLYGAADGREGKPTPAQRFLATIALPASAGGPSR